MEVFICTLSSGELEKGDIQNQKTSNQKQKKFSSIYNLSTHYSLPTIHFLWVGGFVTLGLISSMFLSMPHAHAADSLTNVERAKKVISEVAPIVSNEHQPDITGAALSLEAEDFIQKPMVVETKITAEAPKIKSVKKSTNDGGVHYFPYGYCTYYASQKRTVTWSGNAGTWLKGAKSDGLKTGDDPRVGAIMVTSEGGSAGHVAYVEAVDGGNVTISEMNFKGYGIISSRTILASSKFIKGYIY